MLRSAQDLEHHRIQAADGQIGRVHDLLFHEPTWAVRYVVVDTGAWLRGKQVLVPPRSVEGADPTDWTLHVRLTREQVESSPEVGSVIDRRLESDVHAHFGWEPYWAGMSLTGMPGPAIQSAAEAAPLHRADEGEDDAGADPRLRSAHDVARYDIRAEDGDIGRVSDLIVDDEAWVVRHLVVDTRRWLRGRAVLVDVRWATDVDWLNRVVALDLTRGEIEASPELDPEAPVDREYEMRMYDHYGHPRYWDD